MANHFYGWLAVRLLKAVCVLVGNAGLRGAGKITKGRVSKKFHGAYDETVRWAKLWLARHEAEQ